MARLAKRSYPGFASDRFTIEAYTEQERLLLDLQAASDHLPPGVIVGRLVYFPWADGHAIYIVTKDKPLTLQHVPYGDAWEVPYTYIRGLRRSDIERGF